jgi:adenylate cyclase
VPENEQALWRLRSELLSEPPVLTVADVEAKTGIRADLVRRLWRALGFPLPHDEGEPTFTPEDVATIELMHAGSRAGVMDVDTEVRLARSVGQTVSRLADWQITTLSMIEGDEDDAPGGQISAGLRIRDALGDTYDRILVAAYRRHLRAALSRVAALADVGEDSTTVTRTVGFADLVQFSALSNELDEHRIGDLVELFETRATDVVNSYGGRAVKTLGDSVLFMTDDPATAVDVAYGIVEVTRGDRRLPDVRLGAATGPVILRFGDVFGPPVNLAARLTGIARRNRVIIDEATAEQLPPGRYETRALNPRPVRGFGVIEPIAVRQVS